MSQPIVVGAARNENQCPRTVPVFLAALKRVSNLGGNRFLDVGCGDGAFTVPIGAAFEEVYGVDVQAHNIDQFKARIRDNPKYLPLLTSASCLDFPNEYFDAVLSIETLEHVDDLDAVLRECARVLKHGGQLVITVPNRWHPVEGHGGTLFGKSFSRLPLIPWIPWLHDRVAHARVFTVNRLDGLLGPLGLRRKALSYVWPTFEHGGGGLQHVAQHLLKRTFPLMRWLEQSPVRMFGSSIVARYQKEA